MVSLTLSIHTQLVKLWNSTQRYVYQRKGNKILLMLSGIEPTAISFPLRRRWPLDGHNVITVKYDINFFLASPCIPHIVRKAKRT